MPTRTAIYEHTKTRGPGKIHFPMHGPLGPHAVFTPSEVASRQARMQTLAVEGSVQALACGQSWSNTVYATICP